jgi:hypothetical protein
MRSRAVYPYWQARYLVIAVYGHVLDAVTIGPACDVITDEQLIATLRVESLVCDSVSNSRTDEWAAAMGLLGRKMRIAADRIEALAAEVATLKSSLAPRGENFTKLDC